MIHLQSGQVRKSQARIEAAAAEAARPAFKGEWGNGKR